MSDKQSIKVIGAGGIGSCLLPTLCRYLNYDKRFENVEVTIVDGDAYEDRNAERQIFHRAGNKADVTVEKLKDDFKQIYFRTQTEYLTEDNVIQVIRDKDIVFCCVDNHATRKLLSERVEELDNVVLISGGNDYHDGNVQIHIRENGENITVPITEWHPEIASPKDENPGDSDDTERAGCDVEAQSEPQLVIANNMAAATMLNIFYALLEKKVDFEEVVFDCLTCNTSKKSRGKRKKKS